MSSGEDTNNRGNLPEPTWEDERLSVTSFTKLSPGLVNQFLSSLGYLCGVRVDSDAGPQCTPYQVALTREGKSPYIQEVTDINTELIDTCNRREANYEHCGWSSEALLTLSPWTQLRISNGSKPEFSQPESSVTKRVAVYRLRIEVSQHDLLPTPEFRAAIQDALGRETRSERFQATYRVFEHWGDVIPLVFDVGTSLAITDLKHNYEANAIDLTGLQLYRAIEHHTARVSTRGVNLGVLRSGFGAWLYSPEIPIGHWSQVRVTKAAPITTLLSEEHQTQISDLHSSMISYSPLVFRGETFGDSTCALHSIKSVTIWTNDHVVSLRVAHWSENAEVEGNEERGPGSTFTLETGDYVTQVMTWKDSQGICALQFFTRNGLVSECYGGGGGMPTIMDGAEGCLIGLTVRMKAQIVHEIEGDWCKDTRDEKSGVQWGFSQYYGNEEGTRFDDWTLIGGSTSTFVTSVKVRAGSYSYVDGIQLAYSRPESGSAAALQGSYHGGSGSKEDTLDLDSGEYIISIGGKIEGRIRQLSFTTNLGRKWTVSAKKDSGKQFVCIAPQEVGGRSMRLYSIIGRCDSSQSMNGVLFVWVSV